MRKAVTTKDVAVTTATSTPVMSSIPVTVDAGTVRGVFEDRPFMHVPHTAAQVFWRAPGAAKCPCLVCECGSDCKCVPGSPGCDACGAFQIKAKQAAADGAKK